MPRTSTHSVSLSGIRRRTAISVLVIASLSTLSLAACSSDKSSDSESPVAETTAVESAAAETTAGAEASEAPSTDAAATATEAAAPAGNARELVVARDMDTNSLDPARAYCDTCQIFLTAVYETLMTLDPKDPNIALPRLATKWEANADNTVFTFNLNPDAKFADGSAVESKDVKWSWERLANVKGSASYLMSGIKSIETPDAATVVATFAAPNSAFLPIVAAGYMGIVNSDVATAEGASAAGTYTQAWDGTNTAGIRVAPGAYTFAVTGTRVPTGANPSTTFAKFH